MSLRKYILIALLSVCVLVLLTCGGLFTFVLLDRGPQGPAAYPKFRSLNASYIPFMPAALTPSMSGVRFMTCGFDAMGIMAPDGHVELRFILPPAEAAALEATSAQAAAAIPTSPTDITVESCASLINELATADDADPATNLPPGFRSYIVFRGGENVGGVSINAVTGEVVYWRFDF